MFTHPMPISRFLNIQRVHTEVTERESTGFLHMFGSEPGLNV